MDKGEVVQISPSKPFQGRTPKSATLIIKYSPSTDLHPQVIKAITTKAQLREAALNNNLEAEAPVFKEDRVTRDCLNRTTIQSVPSTINHIAVLEDYLQRTTIQVVIKIWHWGAEVGVFLREMAREIL